LNKLRKDLIIQKIITNKDENAMEALSGKQKAESKKLNVLKFKGNL